MRRSGILVGLVCAGLFLAACAQPAGPEPGPGANAPGVASPEPASPPRSGGARPDPVALIGLWTVVGEPAGTVLRLAPDQLSIFDGCGVHSGTWRAGSTGLFVGHVFGQSTADPARGCMPVGASPTWLIRATGFALTGDGPVLVDARDQPVARLRPGARPTPPVGLHPSEVAPPQVTEEVRRAFRPAAPLPAGLAPAGRPALVGRWVPVGAAAGGAERAYVELGPDGAWRGSDGCNGQQGRWVAGEAGTLLATAGPSTLMACANVSVASWLSGASRAGLDGAALVLLDAAGAELGRLRRDG